MKKINLFRFKKKKISNLDILDTLEKLKVPECDILYVHTDISFGNPNFNITKHQILEGLLKIFLKLNIKTIIFPTYSFSFCRGDKFDYKKTKTDMGVLNEYVRTKYSNFRSLDPLLSNVLIGENKFLIKNIGNQSIGKESTFDLIYKSNLKTNFLFFGSHLHKCFTFMHYLEFINKVNYRYMKKFTGMINYKSKNYKDTYELFVRYSGIESSKGSLFYEKLLTKNKILKKKKLGGSEISCVEKNASIDCYFDLLKKKKNFFIKKPFNKSKNFKIYKKHKSIIAL